LLIALALFAASSGINRAPTMGMISKSAPAAEQGATLGVAQSAGTFARIFGPVTATTFYSFSVPLPYLVSAAIALMAGLVAWQFLYRAVEPAAPATFESAGGV